MSTSSAVRRSHGATRSRKKMFEAGIVALELAKRARESTLRRRKAIILQSTTTAHRLLNDRRRLRRLYVLLTLSRHAKPA